MHLGLWRRILGKFFFSLLLSLFNPRIFDTRVGINDTENENRAEAVEELRKNSPDFLAFPELEKAVEEDVKFLKASKVVPDSVTISGWVYEVETGKTRRVV